MTRGQFFGRILPIAAVLYVIVLLTVHGSALIGAIVLAVIVLVGMALTHPDGGGRPRTARRERRARRRDEPEIKS